MDPITREEQFLNAAVNAANGQETGDLPEPITREEQYLAALLAALAGASSSSRGYVDWDLTDYDLDDGQVNVTETISAEAFRGAIANQRNAPITIKINSGISYEVVSLSSNSSGGAHGEFYVDAGYSGYIISVQLMSSTTKVFASRRMVRRAFYSFDLTVYGDISVDTRIDHVVTREMFDEIMASGVLIPTTIKVLKDDVTYSSSTYTKIDDELLFMFHTKENSTTLGTDFGVRIYWDGTEVREKMVTR